MAEDVDIEALGLLDGLEGDARRERAELIAWLLDRGFKLEHIRASVAAPLMLPAYRVLGDDGDLVSAREICESTGVELDLLQRLQRAVGLPVHRQSRRGGVVARGRRGRGAGKAVARTGH